MLISHLGRTSHLKASPEDLATDLPTQDSGQETLELEIPSCPSKYAAPFLTGQTALDPPALHFFSLQLQPTLHYVGVKCPATLVADIHLIY